MKFRTLALGAIAAVTLAAAATPASAYVACNRWGDCWRVSERYHYRPAWGVRIHDDNWRWRHGDRYRWRHHAGRGYWGRGGVWITF
jgi:hypothetical protein